MDRIRRDLRLHAAADADRQFHDWFQRRKLRWFLKEILAPSQFYQDPEYTSLAPAGDPYETFSRAPLLEKARLKRMSQTFISGRDGTPYFRARTTGSTGVPLEMWFDREYFISFYSRFLYFLRRHNLWPDPSTVSLMSLSVSSKAIYNEDDYSFLVPALNYSYFHRVNIRAAHWQSPAAVVSFIAAQAPLVVRGVPRTLEVLADYVQACPAAGVVRPKLVISTAETLLPATRRRFVEVFGAAVIEEYGLTEVGGVVAVECAEHQGFHIDTVDYYVETVDPAGAPVSDGAEGEIVITNLYHRPVPLFRYRSGDYGVITREPCSCGSVAPRLLKFGGRALSRFSLPGGQSYNPFEVFREYLLPLPVAQFQMVQESDHRITLYYVGDRSIGDIEAIRGLRARVRQLHSDRGELRLRKVNKIETGRKFQVFLRSPELAGGLREPAAGGEEDVASEVP